MSDTERLLALCKELNAALTEAAERGDASERIDELVALSKRAADEARAIALGTRHLN